MNDLITSEQHERMLANGRREQTDDSFEPEPIVKLLRPSLGLTWLLSSLDPGFVARKAPTIVTD